jgi:flotillin
VVGNIALLIVVLLMVLILFGLLFMAANLFRRVGPNQALIVYGMRGTRIITGGGSVVFPMVESFRELSLELMSFDVAPQQDLYTTQGVAVSVEAVAQIKVKSDPQSVRTAAEQFLNKEPSAREALIRLVMEGHLRGIVGQLTVEQIVKEPEMVADRMRGNVADDMSKMGLEVVSFTIKEVRDKNEYIANMGRPETARVKKEADIAAAEADRDTQIKQAAAMREAAVARAEADRVRVIAEMASQTSQAQALRDLTLKKAEFEAETKQAQAQADKAYEIQSNVMQQRVVAEQVAVQRIEREQQVKVQEAEILRRQRELEATVLKAAEAERQRIERLDPA